MAKLKTRVIDNLDSCDEDSYNYLESESESITIDDEEVEEYNYQHKVFDLLYSRDTVLSVFSLVLLGMSYPAWNYKFSVHSTEGSPEEVSLGKVLLATGLGLLSVIGLGVAFEALSMKYLKKSTGNAAYCYYFNELSHYISAFMALLVMYIYLLYEYSSFYLKLAMGFKLRIHHTLRIVMFSLLVLGALKALVKYVSMRFNYNMYINSIKKCILFDFFVNLISAVRESDEDSERIMDESHANNDSETVLSYQVRNLAKPLNTFILKKRFRTDSAATLGFGEKRLLIKEFLNLVSQTYTYTGSMPTILGKIKAKAQSRANKLVRKLRRTDRIQKIGDLSKYFKDIKVFEFFIKQLDLEKSEKIEKNHIADIIERAYKDRYVIYKNLEQINAAIDRVALASRIIIYLGTVFFAFISSTGEIDFISGCVSAIFGTQFISKILSDSVIQSIIFLFVIHPFDIGDRVLIRLGGVQENLVVAELNVFSTTFFKWDGTSLFVPNNVLVDTPISNIRRSGAIMENHSIQVSSKTSPDKLQRLREMLTSFCRERREMYTDYVLVNYERIEDSNKLFIKVLMQYQGNFQHYEGYLQKRSMFILELNRCLKALDIKYKLPTQKVKVIRSKDLSK